MSFFSIDTTMWHQRLGHFGRDTMTLALQSVDITRAKYDRHVPLLSCEHCILVAKLHHAAISIQPDIKAPPCFHAFSFDIFGPHKETGPGGAKYLLGVIDNLSNYICLLGSLRSHARKQLFPLFLLFSLIS
jgi:hypothetical protein